MRSNSRPLAALLVTIAVLALSAPLASAAGSGSIRGRVVGPDGQAVPAIPLHLRNDITGFKADATTGPDGAFQFFNVPFNPYELHVEAPGFQAVHRSVDVRSGVPLEIPVSLKLAGVSETVTVTAEKTAAQLSDLVDRLVGLLWPAAAEETA